MARLSLKSQNGAVDLVYKLFQNYASKSYNYPLYILHGFQSGKDKWYSVAEKISNYGIDVLALDMRNHGESPYLDHHEYEGMVQDIERLRTKLGHQKISIIGHSMGGIAAMLYSLRHTASIKDLIVVDISIYVDIEENDFYETISRIRMPQDPSLSYSQVVDHIVANTESLIGTESLTSFLERKLVIKDGRCQFSYNEMLNQYKHEIIADIPDSIYSERVLFIGGADSSYMTLEGLDKMKSNFPSQEVVYVEGCGHSVYRDDEGKFISLVYGFLFR